MYNCITDILKSKDISFENASSSYGKAITFTTKKLFKKAYYFLFITNDDLKSIEHIVKSLVNDSTLKGKNLVLFCDTNLDIDEKFCFYMGDNQFIYCIYRNIISNKFTYYIDMDTPKLIKEIIKILPNKL